MNPNELDCEYCATKHIGTAHAYMQESVLGYPENRCWAVGELALAESHLVAKWPKQADLVRGYHKRLLEVSGSTLTAIEWRELALGTMALIRALTDEETDLVNAIQLWGEATNPVGSNLSARPSNET